jgi:hypothetical protein
MSLQIYNLASEFDEKKKNQCSYTLVFSFISYLIIFICDVVHILRKKMVNVWYFLGLELISYEFLSK